MSWGIYASGKSGAVIKKVQAEAEKLMQQTFVNAAERDQIKAAATAIIATVGLNTTAVKVVASGSVSTVYDTNASQSNMNIAVEPLYGYVE